MLINKIYFYSNWNESTEFLSDKMLYVLIRGHWCGSIVLNMPAPTENKSNDLNQWFPNIFGSRRPLYIRIFSRRPKSEHRPSCSAQLVQLGWLS
jgi:hypothetical protein